MNRLALSLSFMVFASYSIQSVAFSKSESLLTSHCREYRPYEEEVEMLSAQKSAEIEGAQVALSSIARFCQDRGALSTLKFGPIQSRCFPSFNRPNNILCASCVTTVSASCD